MEHGWKLQLNTLYGGLILYNKGDKIYVAIACGWGDFLCKKVISNIFFDVALVCLKQPRCRFLTNIARRRRCKCSFTSIFMGTWSSARFTHAACEKAEKWINKIERKVKKTRCWKHSLPIALSSCVCWEKQGAYDFLGWNFKVFSRYFQVQIQKFQGQSTPTRSQQLWSKHYHDMKTTSWFFFWCWRNFMNKIQKCIKTDKNERNMG